MLYPLSYGGGAGRQGGRKRPPGRPDANVRWSSAAALALFGRPSAVRGAAMPPLGRFGDLVTRRAGRVGRFESRRGPDGHSPCNMAAPSAAATALLASGPDQPVAPRRRACASLSMAPPPTRIGTAIPPPRSARMPARTAWSRPGVVAPIMTATSRLAFWAASRNEAAGTFAPRSSASKRASPEEVGDDRARQAVLVARLPRRLRPCLACDPGGQTWGRAAR